MKNRSRWSESLALLALGVFANPFVHGAVIPQTTSTQVLVDVTDSVDLGVNPPVVRACSDTDADSGLSGPDLSDIAAGCTESTSGNNGAATAFLERSYGDFFASVAATATSFAEVVGGDPNLKTSNTSGRADTVISWTFGQPRRYSIFVSQTASVDPAVGCPEPPLPLAFGCSFTDSDWGYTGGAGFSGITPAGAWSFSAFVAANSSITREDGVTSASSTFDFKIRFVPDGDACLLTGMATTAGAPTVNLTIEARAVDDNQLLDTGFTGSDGSFLLCVGEPVTLTFRDPVTMIVVHTSPPLNPPVADGYNFDTQGSTPLPVPLPPWSAWFAFMGVLVVARWRRTR